MEEATDGLRNAAPNWSLGGDKQLLDLLQNMHQKIIEKCQETNKNIENMASALDEAGIHLQNVNNRFTALSNSQFVESRVYDDDFADVVPVTPKEQRTTSLTTELDNIKESLFVLERMHETVTILCDSDSDSTSDEEDDGPRLVVKPKDLYASRPLPYIIGSQQWKSKWHAGLIREDSDSESEGVSAEPDREQYSESGTESERASPAMSSYSLDSRNQNSDSIVYNSDTVYSNPVDAPPKTQSDIAAELARRLGASTAKTPIVEPESSEPEPVVVRKLYKPHQPAPGAIFSDEPPPLEADESEESDHDIFAEIYKTSSYAHDKDHVSVADDLFGKPIFDEQVLPSNVSQKPVSNKEVSISNESTPTGRHSVDKEDVTTKKPIGGKSIFGSNANSESIGAAILKRKSRHSSTSGEESDEEQSTMEKPIKTPIHKNNDSVPTKVNNESHNKKERDIFDELFAKSERVNKELDKKQKKSLIKDVITPTKNEKKVDLFSDNLFDDIDDIFTTTATTKVKEKIAKQKTPSKSIFDEEDDDLFSDLAVNKKSDKGIDKESTKSKVLETEDDLFNVKQKVAPVTEVKLNKNIVKNKSISNIVKESKGLFDDSDDDLFSDFKKPKNTLPGTSKSKPRTDDLFSDDDNLFVKTTETKKVTPKLIINESESNNTGDMKTKKFVQSPDLFDDNIDNTMLSRSDTKIDLIKETSQRDVSNTKPNQPAPTPVNIIKYDTDVNPTQETTKADKRENIEPLKKQSVKSKTETKGNLFDDDSEDDLFGKPLKVRPDVSKNETLRESHITKDKSDDILQNMVYIADRTEAAKYSDVDAEVTIPKDVMDECTSDSDLKTTVINTQVIISENISGKTSIVKPENHTEIHTEVSQMQSIDKSEDTNLNITNKIDIQQDMSPDIFPEETESPFPSLSKNMPDSNTDTHKDLLTDIFNDQPPEFEKPKEPKKSKNVNALFDDDSDDESLFFKKNDVVTDERPEGFTTNDDRLFGLFRDEPPAIDVDFIQKPNKKENVESNTSNNEGNRPDTIKSSIFDDDDADIFATKSDSNKPIKKDVKENIFNDSDDFENSFESNDTNNPVIGGKEILITSETKHIFDTVDVPKSKTQDTTDNPQVESKKIGKLKPMSFNINVNTLLPGASPKKSVKTEVKDKNNAGVKTVDKSSEQLLPEEVDLADNTVTNLVKSVSFEGEPDSAVLDNKLSKERAKIQVKRRPSTRRARREAVNKSGIDFGADSTDNATSVDYSKDEKTNETTVKTNFQNEISQTEDKVDMFRHEEIANIEVEKYTTTTTNTKNTNEEDLDREIEKKDSKLEINEQGSTPDDKSVQGAPDFISTNINVTKNINEIKTDLKTHSTQGKEIKKKVVYVLNDDDIFNTSSLKNDTNDTKKSIFDDFKDEDDIFKTIPVSKEQKSAAEDLKLANSVETKLPDEPVKKTEILASDSDSDDLFKKVSKTVTNIAKKSEAENVKTTKEDLFKNLSNPVSSQTSEVNIVNKKTGNTDDLFQNVSKPVTNTAKSEKILLSDSEDGPLFKNKPVPVPNITKTEEACLKTTLETKDGDRSKNISRATITEPNKSVTKISGDEDKNLFNNIPKLGPKSPDTKSNSKSKTSLFDSDEDLFKSSNKKGEKESKASLFGSDSDEELFSGKKKEKEQRREKAQVFKKEIEVKKVVKKSLFGDESDDDDLFGAKKKTVEAKPRSSSSRDVSKDTLVKSKPVLEDPLSLFGDDD